MYLTKKIACANACVRALPGDKRFAFHNQAEKQLKDPDTYAALNYIFIAGLHHFYLGRWGRGLLSISIFSPAW